MEGGEGSTRVPLSARVKYAIIAVVVVVVLLGSSALYQYYSRPDLQITDGGNGFLYSAVNPDCWMQVTVKNFGRSAGDGILYADVELYVEFGSVGQMFICGGSTYVSLEPGQARTFIIQLHMPEQYYDFDLGIHTLFGDSHVYLVTL
jgi:hypothetical protein